VRKRLQAIFFDLGGTLFSNTQIPLICAPLLTEVAKRLGVEGGLPGLGPAFVQAMQEANAQYLKRPYYLHRDLFRDVCRTLARAFDQEATPEFLDWFSRAQREVMTRQPRLRDDCLDTLRALRSRGLELALVSNIDDDYLEPMLENLNLTPLFDHWTSSQAARSCKPDPGIFQHALRRAGCDAEEVLFVGDSRVHDIDGAGRMGMETALISEQGGVSQLDDEHHESNPDHVIHQLSELIEIIDRRELGASA
jgi:putative hydrolase of the HAD superfamily